MNIVYYNGKFLPDTDCLINPNDRGLLLGDGIFETIRLYSGKALLLNEHIDRLKQGLNILDMHLPLHISDIQMNIEKLAQLNKIVGDASVRLTITRGVGPRGISPPEIASPNVLMTIHSFVKTKLSIVATISSIKKNEYSPLSKIKSLNYLENILGRMEAQKLGVDEAIFLNMQNCITSASAANIFLVLNNIIYTPLISDGVLPGITRKIILKIAKLFNVTCFEKTITLDELLCANEIFITNSLIGIQPVVKINDTIINNSQIGSLTKLLQKYFSDYIRGLSYDKRYNKKEVD